MHSQDLCDCMHLSLSLSLSLSKTVNLLPLYTFSISFCLWQLNSSIISIISLVSFAVLLTSVSLPSRLCPHWLPVSFHSLSFSNSFTIQILICFIFSLWKYCSLSLSLSLSLSIFLCHARYDFACSGVKRCIIGNLLTRTDTLSLTRAQGKARSLDHYITLVWMGRNGTDYCWLAGGVNVNPKLVLI